MSENPSLIESSGKYEVTRGLIEASPAVARPRLLIEQQIAA